MTKLIRLDPAPWRVKARCWLRPHDLQLCASAITNRLTWRCRRCTAHFSRRPKSTTG